MGYVYLITTVLLTVYGQLAFKWQVDEAGAFPAQTDDRLEYLARLAANPWMVSVGLSVLAAALTWGGGSHAVRAELCVPVHEPLLRPGAASERHLLR